MFSYKKKYMQCIAIERKESSNNIFEAEQVYYKSQRGTANVCFCPSEKKKPQNFIDKNFFPEMKICYLSSWLKSPGDNPTDIKEAR